MSGKEIDPEVEAHYTAASNVNESAVEDDARQGERGETERDLELQDEQGEDVRGGVLPPDEWK